MPPDRPRIMHGIGRPDRVIEAVELGIDIFDSSYPFMGDIKLSKQCLKKFVHGSPLKQKKFADTKLLNK